MPYVALGIIMIDEFKEVLLNIEAEVSDDFSGIGIVIYSDIEGIPIFPLQNVSFVSKYTGLIPTFVEISKVESPYHDGFHFITSDLTLTHTSQYFSPPIVQGVEVDSSRIIGGRYMAALFGSCLDNILMTGIVTKNNGVVIFKNGEEVYSKDRK